MQGFLIVLILLSLSLVTAGYVIKENTIFSKEAVVTTTESKWTLTLMLETMQYTSAINSLLEKISYAKEKVRKAHPALTNRLQELVSSNKGNVK